jgi:hypothetical protein
MLPAAVAPQAATFAAKLLARQANATGGPQPTDETLPVFNGDRLDQIKLYTFGAPRIGTSAFAAYLENNMRERYR